MTKNDGGSGDAPAAFHLQGLLRYRPTSARMRQWLFSPWKLMLVFLLTKSFKSSGTEDTVSFPSMWAFILLGIWMGSSLPLGFPSGSAVKNPPAIQQPQETRSIPGSGRSPGGGYGNLLQYSCLGESQGQRNLVSYSPRGCKESDTIVATEHHFFVWRTSPCLIV